jgi:hypothetical protein
MRGNLRKFHGEYSTRNLNFEEEHLLAREEFRKVFDFESQSVIPCTFILDKAIQECLIESGIKIIQGANRLIDINDKKRYLPMLRMKQDVLYNARNARLDVHPDYEKFANVNLLIQCMEEAFESSQPCVIDFHRVNFVSKYSREWSDNCLFDLNTFFKYCSSKHPDIIFMNTVEFYEYLLNGNTLDALSLRSHASVKNV